MMTLLWKIKKLVAFVMFVAAIIALISFFMNMSNVSDMFAGSGFSAIAAGVAELVQQLGTPLILFTLGLLTLFIPRPGN